ncbi:hypothetical protein VTO73DRAFT_2807 [Trametes versicolor]
MRYPLRGKPSDIQLSPKYPRAMAVSPQNVNPPPIGSIPAVASEPSATSDLNAFYAGNAQHPCNGSINLLPYLYGLYSFKLDGASAAETIRSFESVNHTSRPLVLPPAGPDATSPASLCPPRVVENRGAIGSSLGGAGSVTAVRQRVIHCDSFSDTGSARKSHPWSVGRDFDEDLVAPMALFDIDNPMPVKMRLMTTMIWPPNISSQGLKKRAGQGRSPYSGAQSALISDRSLCLLIRHCLTQADTCMISISRTAALRMTMLRLEVAQALPESFLLRVPASML